MYSRAPAITSKPAITYCCLHARHEVQPINLNGGLLMKWALEKVYKAAKHLNSEINCCLKHKNKGGEALPHRSCGCAHPRQHQISPQPAPCSCCTAPASPPAARCPHLQAFGWQKALSFLDKWKIEAGRGEATAQPHQASHTARGLHRLRAQHHSQHCLPSSCRQKCHLTVRKNCFRRCVMKSGLAIHSTGFRPVFCFPSPIVGINVGYRITWKKAPEM